MCKTINAHREIQKEKDLEGKALESRIQELINESFPAEKLVLQQTFMEESSEVIEKVMDKSSELKETVMDESSDELKETVMDASSEPQDWNEFLRIQKASRYHLSEEQFSMCYTYTRDYENHLKPYPPPELQKQWEMWSDGKFYIDQSRVILSGIEKCQGLFTQFVFLNGDVLPYEGTIHNVKDGEETPEDLVAAISEGYTLKVHQTGGFKCYIIGTKGL